MKEREWIRGLLQETTTLTLATLDPDGTPRATPLFFAADRDLRIFFLSDPRSQHSDNLEREPRCAIGLDVETEGVDQIRGLQMKGHAGILREDERDMALDLYGLRFPFINELSLRVVRCEIFGFCPTWVRIIDNRRGFGYHKEFVLS